MSEHYPVLIVIIPFIFALIVAFAGFIKPRLCCFLTISALILSLYSSIILLFQVFKTGCIEYRLSGWSPPWGICYNIDYLNSIIIVVVMIVGLMCAISSQKAVNRDLDQKKGAFYALFLLFITGLTGILATGDLFNLYVLLEITSISGYALIGTGNNKAAFASLKYLFMGTIGASFYLLGIGYLYISTGSLNMADIAAIIPELQQSKTIMFAFIFCMTGLFIKMGMFPMHGWLPNAYSDSHSATSTLVASLTTKVMLYVMIRLILNVFLPDYSFSKLNIDNIMVWFATVVIICGSFLALSQKNLKYMLSYIIITEVGYIAGGFWLGNRLGMTGAILHILNDALMTMCLFLSSANFIYVLKNDSFKNFKDIFLKMPFSAAGFVIGGASIIGVPPTCGFFSKWYLLSAAQEAGHYEFFSALIFSSLICCILFFRIIEQGFFSEDDHENNVTKFNEAPVSMIIPLGITVLLLIAAGIYSGDIITNFIDHAIPDIIT